MAPFPSCQAARTSVNTTCACEEHTLETSIMVRPSDNCGSAVTTNLNTEWQQIAELYAVETGKSKASCWNPLEHLEEKIRAKKQRRAVTKSIDGLVQSFQELAEPVIDSNWHDSIAQRLTALKANINISRATLDEMNSRLIRVALRSERLRAETPTIDYMMELAVKGIGPGPDAEYDQIWANLRSAEKMAC